MANPTNKVRVKNIQITVWENQNGKSYTVQKSYKKKDSEEWINETLNLFESELKALKEALQQL